MINTTLATAFYDIGRGKWSSYKRNVEDYMTYFKNVSRFTGNMVIHQYDRVDTSKWGVF